MEHVCNISPAARYPQAVAIAHRATPGHHQNTEPCRVDERQLFKIEQDPNAVACLGLSQCMLQAGALG